MAGVAPITAVQQFFFNAGTLAANGTLETLVANSGTRSPTWTDKAQTSNFLNTNPITLDSRGECTLWLDPLITYDFILRDNLGSTIRTYEDVSGAGGLVSGAITSEWADPALVATFISGTTFSLVGDQTSDFSINRRIRATISGGFRYGSITNSIFSSVTTVTVLWDSGVIDASLSKIEYGIISANNTSAPGTSVMTMNNGYKVFTDGFIMQWGTVSTSSVASTVVTLQKPLTVGVFASGSNAGTSASTGNNYGSCAPLVGNLLTQVAVNTFDPAGVRVSLAGVQWWVWGK